MSLRLSALLAALVLAAPASAQAATAKPSGPGCDRLDDAACLLPFPNDAFTAAAQHQARMVFVEVVLPRLDVPPLLAQLAGTLAPPG